MAEINLEDIAVYLPKYLSPTEQKGLYEELKKFPNDSFKFYDETGKFDHELLQGDSWRGLMAINFQTLEKKAISGVVISNSCDVDINNRRAFSPNILFAPLIKLSDFKNLLEANGDSKEIVAAKVLNIKKQFNTSSFYMPECPGKTEESIILLDDIHRHPLSDFKLTEKSKIFTLTQAAFYLFLIKLSIHFHRVQEGVHRYIPDEQAA